MSLKYVNFDFLILNAFDIVSLISIIVVIKILLIKFSKK